MNSQPNEEDSLELLKLGMHGISYLPFIQVRAELKVGSRVSRQQLSVTVPTI